MSQPATQNSGKKKKPTQNDVVKSVTLHLRCILLDRGAEPSIINEEDIKTILKQHKLVVISA